MFYSWLTSLRFLLLYSPKPYGQVWILIYRNWSIFQAYQFKGAVCLKALFFVDFRPFFLNNYNVARISLEIKKWLHVLSWRITRSYPWRDYNIITPKLSVLMHTRGGTTIVTQQEKLKTKPDNRWTIYFKGSALSDPFCCRESISSNLRRAVFIFAPDKPSWAKRTFTRYIF